MHRLELLIPCFCFQCTAQGPSGLSPVVPCEIESLQWDQEAEQEKLPLRTSQSEKRKWIDNIDYFKMLVGEVIVNKKLLLNMDSLGIYVDNVEGVTFGPTLPNGHRTLVLVADNNFQFFEKTQFFLFEIVP